MSEPSDASNEPLEVKLIAAASDGMVNVTPEKCERIRKLLQSPPPAPAASGELRPLAITDDQPEYEWNGEFRQEAIDRGVQADKGALASSEQAADDEEQIHIRIRNVLAVIYGGAPMDNLLPEVQSLVKHWQEQAAPPALADWQKFVDELPDFGERGLVRKIDVLAALERSGLPGKEK